MQFKASYIGDIIIGGLVAACLYGIWKPNFNKEVPQATEPLLSSVNGNAKTALADVVDKITEDSELKLFKIEAVSRGKAKWVTDKNGDVEFEWLSNPVNTGFEKNERDYILATLKNLDKSYTLLGTINTPKAVVTNEVVKAKSIRFGVQEFNLAKKFDYDIETFLKSRISLKIYDAFKLWDGKDRNELQKKIENEVNTCIKEGFDGFETYNRIFK